MNLHDYIFRMPKEQRKVFAEKCGTSRQYLEHVAYGYKPLSPRLASMLEIASYGVMQRKQLLPDFPWDTTAASK